MKACLQIYAEKSGMHLLCVHSGVDGDRCEKRQLHFYFFTFFSETVVVVWCDVFFNDGDRCEKLHWNYQFENQKWLFIQLDVNNILMVLSAVLLLGNLEYETGPRGKLVVPQDSRWLTRSRTLRFLFILHNQRATRRFLGIFCIPDNISIFCIYWHLSLKDPCEGMIK